MSRNRDDATQNLPYGVYLDEKTVKRMHRVVAQNKEEARKGSDGVGDGALWVGTSSILAKTRKFESYCMTGTNLVCLSQARTKAGLPEAETRSG